MCILCQAKSGLNSVGFGGAPAYARAYAGQGTSVSASASGVHDVDALISGSKWGTTALKFALPTLASQYTAYDPAIDETSGFAPVDRDLAANVRAAMAHISLYTGLAISETSSVASANLLLGRTDQTGAGHAYLPDGSTFAGDVWFSSSPDYDKPLKGSHANATVLHEICHALGLKHAHTFIGGTGATEDDIGVIAEPVSAARDSLEFTIMTYRSYVNQDLETNEFYTNEEYGFPQSLMMLDIAALQHMYGADFNANSSDTTYRFSPTTGEMFINGTSQGAPGANRIFLTVWDGGGKDTYDLSAYTTGLRVDLAPGSHSTLSTAQLAILDDASGRKAVANVFNALQYQGDVRSLIENAIGGSGNDTMSGNATGNSLSGGGGIDVLYGLAGSDSLSGNAGHDQLIGDGPVSLTTAAQSINRLYIATLDRAPDEAGWQSWTAQRESGQALSTIAAGFVESAEFKTKYGALDNAAFVTKLYQNVLDREPDAGGLAVNVNALNASQITRTQLVVNFSESAEFIVGTTASNHAGQIYRLYGATLGRTPDAGGFESWTDAQGKGQGLVSIAAGFVGSTEFQTRYGNQTDAGFVSLLYQNVLGRTPDAAGLSYWTQQLATQMQSRTQVVTGFSESAEYVAGTRVGIDTYMRTTMVSWSDTLVGGAGDDRLTGGRGSDRYVFAASDGGNDTVYGFEHFDTLELSGFGFANSTAALSAMVQQGGNVVLNYTGGSITFENTQLSTLQSLTAQGWVFA